MSYRYRTFDLGVASDIPLHETLEVDVPTVVDVRLGSALAAAEGGAFTFEEYSFQKCTTGGLLISFRDTALCVREGREILISTPNPKRTGLLSGIVSNIAMPLLLAQRGILPFHGVAAEIEGRGALILGKSGTGKSTLLGALLARGHRLLCDRIIGVELRDGVPWLLPRSPYLWLTAATIERLREGLTAQGIEVPTVPPDRGARAEAFGKIHGRGMTFLIRSLRKLKLLPWPMAQRHAVHAKDRYAAQPLPLSRIYLLENASDLELSPASVQGALPELMAHARYPWVDSLAEFRDPAFRLCATFLRTVPAIHFRRPPLFAQLGEHVRLLEEDVRTLHALNTASA